MGRDGDLRRTGTATARTVRAAAFAAVVAFGLAACGGGGESAAPPKGDAAICREVSSAASSFGDKNYSDWEAHMKQIGEAKSVSDTKLAAAVERATTLFVTPTTTAKGSSDWLSRVGAYNQVRARCAALNR
jgi:hypothetical protein